MQRLDLIYRFKTLPRFSSLSRTYRLAVILIDWSMLIKFLVSLPRKSRIVPRGIVVILASLKQLLNNACSPDLHTQQTASNLAALLVAPINSYQSVLTLLAIPNYVPLLTKQLFSTRRSIAHSIVSSVLKNETIIESPEDVDGVLELCHVLIKDQTDSSGRGSSGGAGAAATNGQSSNMSASIRRQGTHFLEREEMAEEQGWVARMVHLFRAESLEIQFEVNNSSVTPISRHTHVAS